MAIASDAPQSSNFAFLSERDPILIQLATTAENTFYANPNRIQWKKFLANIARRHPSAIG
ncbi:hypothetical protein [Zhongshania sp. BJYM1]|jgi:hypothetical protein|uniref:hypothetical protein n=1 Tax=Zhongshania aquatica TaxID=2965069 RepID=UPI0022B5313F|nr:hypothetical protein [Marortus sp. BJYM1]